LRVIEKMRLKQKKLLVGSLVIMAALFIQACGPQMAAPQESCHFVQNSHQQRVSWKDQTPVKLYLHSSVPSNYYAAIERATNVWNRALGREVLRIELTGVTGSQIPSRDGDNMIYWLYTWEESRPMEQARTTVYWSGDRIYEADIRINARNFHFYGGEKSEDFTGVDLESLMIHEFGHVLGLAHNHKEGSVMNLTLNSGALRRDLSKEDLSSISCEY